eukprot:5523174-Prymnesium_polylepis.1
MARWPQPTLCAQRQPSWKVGVRSGPSTTASNRANPRGSRAPRSVGEEEPHARSSADSERAGGWVAA